jgi:ribosomal protein L15
MVIPQFHEIYEGFIKLGFKPKQASIKAHAVIRAHVLNEREDSESESDDEYDSRRVISKEIEKMRIKLAGLSNKYKQDKNLPLIIRYLTKAVKKY